MRTRAKRRCGDVRSAWRIGSANAPVLPEPVSAKPMISRSKCQIAQFAELHHRNQLRYSVRRSAELHIESSSVFSIRVSHKLRTESRSNPKASSNVIHRSKKRTFYQGFERARFLFLFFFYQSRVFVFHDIDLEKTRTKYFQIFFFLLGDSLRFFIYCFNFCSISEQI